MRQADASLHLERLETLDDATQLSITAQEAEQRAESLSHDAAAEPATYPGQTRTDEVLKLCGMLRTNYKYYQVPIRYCLRKSTSVGYTFSACSS